MHVDCLLLMLAVQFFHSLMEKVVMVVPAVLVGAHLLVLFLHLSHSLHSLGENHSLLLEQLLLLLEHRLESKREKGSLSE